MGGIEGSIPSVTATFLPWTIATEGGPPVCLIMKESGPKTHNIVDSKKLEQGCRMIYAGSPSF